MFGSLRQIATAVTGIWKAEEQRNKLLEDQNAIMQKILDELIGPSKPIGIEVTHTDPVPKGK